jgi:hypothetical protein
LQRRNKKPFLMKRKRRVGRIRKVGEAKHERVDV